MGFSIHTIYAQVFRIWRAKRMLMFLEVIKPQSDEVILDVGGLPASWRAAPPHLVQRIDCLNIQHRATNDDNVEQHAVRVIGDGCQLEYEDDSYDIVFSNSVIEHVGDFERQKQFAAEVRRVGRRLWVQTPAYECPLEPHFLAPFVHWLPVWVRIVVARWLTPWGWLTRPSRQKTEEVVRTTQLLTRRQMQQLFPDCQLITERLLGILPKSYIAYRGEAPSSEPGSQGNAERAAVES